MASGFVNLSGTDLDSVFAPWHSGWPQAGLTDFDVSGGSDLNTRYATLATGSAAAATKFVLSTGADLNTIFAAFGSTGVQVLTQPSAVSGASAAGRPSGTVTSGTTSCAGTKGGGSYSYTVHLTIPTGSNIVPTAPNSNTSGVTGTIPAGQTYTGTMYWAISDGVTSVNTNSVPWSLQNTTPAFVSAISIHTSGSGNDTAPAGAGHVTIEVWGAGGGGGGAEINSGTLHGGGGGGGGACASKTYVVAGGDTISYAVGTGGAGVSGGQGAPGGTSTASSGPLSISLSSTGGTGGGTGSAAGGGAAGAGGTATGGSTNTTGNSGHGGTTGGGGLGAMGITGTVSGDGSPYGGGGNGSSSQGTAGLAGSGGAVVFYYLP